MNLISQKILKEDYLIDDNLDRNNSSLIYGEVCHDDILKIIKNLELDNRLFVDIGSGCGKLVSYLAYKLDIMIDGIEIDENRYTKSFELINKLNLENNIYLYNCNFKDIYLGNYDVIYCCNLVFTNDDNNILYDKIINEFEGLVLLFNYNHKIKSNLIKVVEVKTSWNEKQNLFIFKI